MKDIYSKATEVIAWLGPLHDLLEDFEWSITTFKAAVERSFGTLDSENHTRPSTVPSVLADQRFWKFLKLPFSYYRLERATKFSAICRWFNRSWIVQEAVLAKQVKLLCGSHWLPWTGVKWLGIMFSTPWKQIVHNAGMPGWLQFAPSPGYRVWEFQLHRNQLMTKSDEMFTVPPTSGIPRFLALFLNLLREFRRTECSDGRDKIYSLLGLAYANYNRDNQVAEDLIPVDYKKYTTADVYHYVASLVLEHLEHLYLLSLVEDDVTRSTPSLPSWVPDFTGSMGAFPLPSNAPVQQRPFRVWGQRYPYTHRPEIHGNELKVWGTKVDTIELNILPFGGPAEDLKGLKFLKILEFCLPDVQRDPSISRVATLMWTALMRDPDHLGDQSAHSLKTITTAYRNFHLVNIATELYQSTTKEPEDEEALVKQVETFLDQLQPEIEARELPSMESILEYKSWITTVYDGSIPLASRQPTLKKISDIELSRSAYVHFADRVSTARRVFRTQLGVLGQGSPSFAEDDEIWMLHGGDVPFILRPCHGGGDDIFRLIGDCYLHGYMYGEKLVEDPGLKDKIWPIVLV